MEKQRPESRDHYRVGVNPQGDLVVFWLIDRWKINVKNTTPTRICIGNEKYRAGLSDAVFTKTRIRMIAEMLLGLRWRTIVAHGGVVLYKVDDVGRYIKIRTIS